MTIKPGECYFLLRGFVAHVREIRRNMRSGETTVYYTLTYPNGKKGDVLIPINADEFAEEVERAEKERGYEVLAEYQYSPKPRKRLPKQQLAWWESPFTDWCHKQQARWKPHYQRAGAWLKMVWNDEGNT